jgi:hypothetical protein
MKFLMLNENDSKILTNRLRLNKKSESRFFFVAILNQNHVQFSMCGIRPQQFQNHSQGIYDNQISI